MKQNHDLAAMAAKEQRRRARRIEVILPTSSLEVFDNDQTMEAVSDNEPAVRPASFHAGLIMEQAHAHFDMDMVEEQAAPQSPADRAL